VCLRSTWYFLVYGLVDRIIGFLLVLCNFICRSILSSLLCCLFILCLQLCLSICNQCFGFCRTKSHFLQLSKSHFLELASSIIMMSLCTVTVVERPILALNFMWLLLPGFWRPANFFLIQRWLHLWTINLFPLALISARPYVESICGIHLGK